MSHEFRDVERTRPSRPAQAGHGDQHRHRDRVLRLHRVRDRRGPGLQPGLLPRTRPADRHAAVVRRVLHRLPRPAARSRPHRTLRGPGRTQAHVHGHGADDGRRDRADRGAADLSADRRARPGRPAPAPRAAGPGRRRGVGRRRTGRRGARTARPAGALRLVLHGRHLGRRPAGHRGLRAAVRPRRGGVPAVGLAAALPRERGAARRRGSGSGGTSQNRRTSVPRGRAPRSPGSRSSS